MNFPAGNMFWAKNKAIHQMTNEKIILLSHEESDQIDRTILNAFEIVLS